MRILHVVPTYVPAWRYGGPIKSVHGLCQGLAAIGHDVHVFTTNVDGPGHLDVPIATPVAIDGVSVRYFASNHLKRLYWAPRMRRALEAEIDSFDVLHLHSIYLWPTSVAARIARRHRVPYLHAPRGMLVPELVQRKSRWLKTAWLNVIERANLEGAAAVHFTSLVELQAAAELGFTFDVTCCIPNGLDRDEIEGRAGADTGAAAASLRRPYLVFVGRVNWKKGLDRLLEALARLPGIDLMIVGNDEEGYQRELEQLASRLGVSARVTFAGAVYGAGKRALLEGAAALVLPSYSENFGNVVLEAMAAGRPVIVTPEVGAAELVKDTGAGIVVDGAPANLAAGIESLLRDPVALEEMGARGRRAVLVRFSWEAIARQMEEVYRGVIPAPAFGASASAA